MFEKIGRYQLVSLIGGGGMGEVWSVVDPGLGIAKALKVLRPSLGWDEQYRSMFAREAKVAAQLGRHPGFPAIHDFDASGDLPYLVMDYIDGVNLRALIPDGGLAEGFVVHVMRSLFRALQIAHSNRRGNSEANVVHGDLKPENIMVSSHGDVFLTDFGISRVVEGRIVTSSIIGTIPYMAPETFDGVVCVQSDLFSAGLILHELLGGERVNPKGSTVLDVKTRYKRGVPSLGIEVHPELESLRQLLLQLDVDQRLPSAEYALDKLKRVDVADRSDELAGQYLRLIGPPHTGLTQYLQALDSEGSFLPGYFRSQKSIARAGEATTSSPKQAPEELEGPGHTVAVSDEELRAIREGRSFQPESELPEASIPTPSDVLHASTEPVDFDSLGPASAAEPEAEGGSGRLWWLKLCGLLMVSIFGGIGAGYLLLGGAAVSRMRSGADDTGESVPETERDVGGRLAKNAPARDEPESGVEPRPRLEIPTSTLKDSSNEDASLAVADAPVAVEENAPRSTKPSEEAAEDAPKPRARPAEKVKVVFYLGAGHTADVIKVGRKKIVVSDLRGEPVFETMLLPGRVTLSFCEQTGACRRFGAIRVPRLGSTESLFVNLRRDKPQVQRREER
ncbi:MAG: serine/threonine protein kinase [Nannocystales bacterium]